MWLNSGNHVVMRLASSAEVVLALVLPLCIALPTSGCWAKVSVVQRVRVSRMMRFMRCENAEGKAELHGLKLSKCRFVLA